MFLSIAEAECLSFQKNTVLPATNVGTGDNLGYILVTFPESFGRVVSVGDLEPGVPVSIPSRDATVMVECPWARYIS